MGAQTYGGGGDSECREMGHRHMVGETMSVERWGAQTYGGGRQ